MQRETQQRETTHALEQPPSSRFLAGRVLRGICGVPRTQSRIINVSERDAEHAGKGTI